MRDIDKFRGCLIGGAAGDALGYPVEFLSASEIFSRYGDKGITEYKTIDGIAEISDDTQMTLFTANGLLVGTTRGMTRGIKGPYPSYIANCYKDWFKTQTENFPVKDDHRYSWLLNIPELFNRRAPGNTCLSAIKQGANGTIENPINTSKGCGGIMRVAPIGLYFIERKFELDEINMIGAEVAAITHGHELGYIPAAVLVHIIYLLGNNPRISIKEAVVDSMNMLDRLFSQSLHVGELKKLIEKAILLSETDCNDLEAISELGEGWAAEETLAIAVYCALKYPDDFDKATVASVNHDGDSDSTGSVTGSILGTYLGIEKIPVKYIENLELKDVILEMADDLYNDCKISEYGRYRDDIWESKYIYMNYKKSD